MLIILGSAKHIRAEVIRKRLNRGGGYILDSNLPLSWTRKVSKMGCKEAGRCKKPTRLSSVKMFEINI